MKHVAYTDGSCLGNPGRGGMGAVVYIDGSVAHTFSQGYYETTNNRMELMAVVFVLEKFGDAEDITIWTDSKYVQQGMTKWMDGWKMNNWRRGRHPIKNIDLWQKLDELNKPHIKYHWVKGHANDEGNETADALATTASARGPFIQDTGFIR